MRLKHSLAVPLLLAALTAVAGCAGEAAGDDGIASADNSSSAGPSPSSSPSASVSDEDRGIKFAQCMRANGVDMPDPDPNGQPGIIKLDRNDPKFAAAWEKCKQYSPVGNGDRTFSPEQQQRMLDFAKCMREHGINMPDPEPGGGIKITKGSGLNPDDPKFQAALEACRQYMPQRPGTK
jgi:hypothetical protein